MGFLKLFLQDIAKGIFILGLLICLCPLLVYASIQLSSAVDRQQQLTSLDRQFAVSRRPIPDLVSDDAILPAKVANFRRMGDTKHFSCEADLCLFSAYRADQPEFLYLNITLQYWANHARSVQTLNDMKNVAQCGPEGAGDSSLRTDLAVPYVSRFCSYMFSARDLDSLAWVNGQWLIQIEGGYDSMSQFINNYPY